MAGATDRQVPRATFARLAIIFVLYVGVACGVMALLGQEPAWGVFSGIALVTVLGMRRRSRRPAAAEG
jgi:hypothetical protein